MSSWVSATKSEVTVAVRKATKVTPNTRTSEPINRPQPEVGTMSPYPTVLMVTIAHHMPSPTELNSPSSRILTRMPETTATEKVVTARYAKARRLDAANRLRLLLLRDSFEWGRSPSASDPSLTPVSAL